MITSSPAQKHPTGIPGVDDLTLGGLPAGQATLVAGSAGSGKTVLVNQFLARGIEDFGEPGVFVTFEETPAAILRHVAGFGWDAAGWERSGQLAFVDASPQLVEDAAAVGNYDLSALSLRIRRTVETIGARRLVLDSVGALLARLPNPTLMRNELSKLILRCREIGVTTLITVERTEEYGRIARHGIEEFVFDSVIVLRHLLQEGTVRRTIQVLKYRGAEHKKGESVFTIVPGRGIVLPLLPEPPAQRPPIDERVSLGVPSLDAMCGGGLFRGSLTLVSGATGTGKTLIATQFLGGVGPHERGILVALEEKRDQLLRNARSWGIDYQRLQREDRLRILLISPENDSLDDQMQTLTELIASYRPDRLALDSLSALERTQHQAGQRDFVLRLAELVREQRVTSLFTATTAGVGPALASAAGHLSSITDGVLLLNYVEVYGEMRRALSVLKMRGTDHDKTIREITIGSDGLHLGRPFRNVSGIIAGQPTLVRTDELERMNELFTDEAIEP